MFTFRKQFAARSWLGGNLAFKSFGLIQVEVRKNCSLHLL